MIPLHSNWPEWRLALSHLCRSSLRESFAGETCSAPARANAYRSITDQFPLSILARSDRSILTVQASTIKLNCVSDFPPAPANRQDVSLEGLAAPVSATPNRKGSCAQSDRRVLSSGHHAAIRPHNIRCQLRRPYRLVPRRVPCANARMTQCAGAVTVAGPLL